MPASRTGTRSRSSSMPSPPLPAISTEDEVSPAAPMSWIATIASVCISSRQASISSFSVNGSPTCTVGRFSAGVLAEFGRGHRRAVDAVAPGLGADIDHEVSRPGGGRIEDAVGARQPDAHRVDQDVAVIGGVELALAADRRHADAIAVAADPGHDPRDEMAGQRMVGAAEAQRIEQRDRARAHREHVAQDAADPGRRALIRLDERGVVVALDLEDDRVAVADIDDPGILARSADHARPRGRQVCAATPSTICTSSARSTSPRRCRARSGSACGPRIAQARANSSPLSPCSAASSG